MRREGWRGEEQKLNNTRLSFFKVWLTDTVLRMPVGNWPTSLASEV